jgi:flavodoxin
MPKILVIFDSKTGNTETMALAVAKGAEMADDLEARSIYAILTI